MGYSLGDISRSAQVNRGYVIQEGETTHSGRTVDPDLDPFDLTPNWHTTEGSSIADETSQAIYVDPENASLAAAARCLSTSRATVDGYKVSALYVNMHEVQSTHPTVSSMARDFGRARAQRLFVPDGSDTKISGVCRINSDLLTGIGYPEPPDPGAIAMKVYAGATMGVSEPTTFIKAEWMREETPKVWRVSWQYVYFDGTQHQVESGTYDLSNFAAVQKLTDFVHFEYNLGETDQLQIRAYQNLEFWDDVWWGSHKFAWGSLYQTVEFGETGGAVRGAVTREAITEVDEQYTARTFPNNPRSS